MNRLKRCPFCGGKVTIASMTDEDDHWFYVHGVYNGDANCHCRVFMESEKFRDDASTDEIKAVRSALVTKWNRRDG